VKCVRAIGFLISSASLLTALSAAAQTAANAAGGRQADARTCREGFVWREASPGDKACVPPQTRAQAAADNAAASTRTKDDGYCLQGFVWRDAGPDDHVCVPPETRSQAAADNVQGPYRLAQSDPTTCRQGFVWREAFPGDKVCVTPRTRAQAAEDRAAAPGRTNADGSCVEGFVPRNAGPNDQVCVPPMTRSQAAGDNAQAPFRLAEPPFPGLPRRASRVLVDEDMQHPAPEVVGLTPECNELAAEEMIYVVIVAEARFRDTHAAWSRSLKAVDFRGSLPGHWAPWVEQTGAAVAVGTGTEFESVGYSFRYTPLVGEASGIVDQFTIETRPLEYGKTGRRSFLLRWPREKLHITTEDRPARFDDAESEYPRETVKSPQCLPGRGAAPTVGAPTVQEPFSRPNPPAATKPNR